MADQEVEIMVDEQESLAPPAEQAEIAPRQAVAMGDIGYHPSVELRRAEKAARFALKRVDL